jgi:hypothetical protein
MLSVYTRRSDYNHQRSKLNVAINGFLVQVMWVDDT